MRPRYTYEVTYEKYLEQLDIWVQDGYRTTTDAVRMHAARLKKRAKMSRKNKDAPFGGQVRNVRIVRIDRGATDRLVKRGARA